MANRTALIAQAAQAEREEEARRLAQEALNKREDEAAARRYAILLPLPACPCTCGIFRPEGCLHTEMRLRA